LVYITIYYNCFHISRSRGGGLMVSRTLDGKPAAERELSDWEEIFGPYDCIELSQESIDFHEKVRRRSLWESDH